jgi:hypothetical protein
VRWVAYELAPPAAGALSTARVRLENAGLAPWRSLNLSYHWLDERGNPIVWDGLRYPLEAGPGETLEVEAAVRAPIPPGGYRLAFDLVEENRFWLEELGNRPLAVDVEVRRRNASAAQAHLADGIEPAPGWLERVREAHELGYAAVGGSVDAGRRPPGPLRPYAPGGGRNPVFPHPLVCPSLLPPLVPNDEVAGLPAWRPEGEEPWLYDARITLRLRSGRPRGGT